MTDEIPDDALSSRHTDSKEGKTMREEIAEVAGLDYDPHRGESYEESRRAAPFTVDQLARLTEYLGVEEALTSTPTRTEVTAAVSGAVDFPMDERFVRRRSSGIVKNLKKPGVAAIHEEVVGGDE